MREDIQFIEQFFYALKNNNITYCIMRNSDEVEMGDAHDIDMSVDINHLVETEQILLKTAHEMGWKLHLKMGSSHDDVNIKCYHLFFVNVNENKIYIVHFDFFPTFVWDGYILISNVQLLADIDSKTIYHKASPQIEAVTKLFIRLLHNGNVKEKYKDDIYHSFSDYPYEVKRIMEHFLDSKTSEFVSNAVNNKKWTEMETKRNEIVDSIKKNAKSNQFKRIIYLIKKAVKKASLMIAFEGTDGSGKSTIIKELPLVLGNTFNEDLIDYYHWRPGVIKKKKDKNAKRNSVSEPHAKEPYNKVISLLKFCYFNFDYFFGYWFKIRWQLSKGHLVVFDRYYYDYYLDKIRYRLDISDRLLDSFRYFIPKPDITFLLKGDAEELYRRKKEISAQEIKAQTDRLIRYQNRFNNSIFIDVNQDIEKVVFDVSVKILEVCSENTNV